ncbi:OpgC domain-containing protein [Nocardioides aquiterrae]|uniref:GH26 domain-containing protein n=1 Tax=Nocardioides aquiterrae TaxID=203799 RepID=A0ABP4EYM3_9ACTN
MTRRLLGTLLLALLAALVGVPAAAADDPVRPEPGAPWFGPGLDSGTGEERTPEQYADGLGLDPSLVTIHVGYPLAEDDVSHLEDETRRIAAIGAVVVLDVEPEVPLADLTRDDATTLAAHVAEAETELDSQVLVRFAPEMNGSWRAWGQQPTAYTRAFRDLADVLHTHTERARTVWSPVYGSGYPFTLDQGADSDLGDEIDRVADELDTSGDGQVTEADDPYGPYYPGDGAVDWVGLYLYRLGQSQGVEGNTVPDADEYERRLAEDWGYADPAGRDSFYDRFAAGHGKPMLVETGALYDPSVEGAAELDLKRAWWRQVLAATSSHPLIGGISWLEVERVEPEVDDRPVDWRATHTGALTRALRADLRSAGVTLGPVTERLDQDAGNAATAQGRLPGADDAGDEMGWIVFCAALLAIAFVVAGAVGRWVPSWRYPHERDPRDQRLDLFRGWIILTVVLTHTELASPYSYVSLNAIGAITGAEMFVLLSGIVLGMIYEPTVRKLGEKATAVVMLKRARKQYLVALVVVLLVFVIGLLPLVDATVITTFTDRGTGQGGQADAGRVYDLYANAHHLFDYPPPWYAVEQLLLLQMGPWVFNIMGLFVVLSLALPLLMWFIRRRMWWLVLAVSWALFVLQARYDWTVLPSQFEAVFPILTWQIAFTHGLVIGYYRTRLTGWLTSLPGRIACTVFVLGYAGALVWLWAAHAHGVPSPFEPGTYDYLYAHAYTRVFLQPGRLLDLALVIVVAYAVLTALWKPVNAAVGWFWTPLGAASLYVFVVHVFFVLAIANIPGLDRDSVWQGTVIHTAEILLIWLMVRKKFLFSVIPR